MIESPEQRRQQEARARTLALARSRPPPLGDSGFARLSLMVNTIFGLLVAVDTPGASPPSLGGKERPAA